jgi:hypothetical protein
MRMAGARRGVANSVPDTQPAQPEHTVFSTNSHIHIAFNSALLPN